MKRFLYILISFTTISASSYALSYVSIPEPSPIPVALLSDSDVLQSLSSLTPPPQYVKIPSPWKFKGNLGINMTGNGLANWAAGGASNISLFAYSRLNLHYEHKTLAWDTNLNLEYGAQWKNQEFDKFQETNDKIDLNSKFGFRLNPTVNISAYASFLSQFGYTHNYSNSSGPDYITGKFLAPAYFDIGIGVDYNPFEWLSVYVAPLSGRSTIVYVGKNMNKWYARRMQEAVNKEGSTLTEADIERYLDNGDPCWGLERELKNKFNVWNYGHDGERRNYDRNSNTDMGLLIRAKGKYSIVGINFETMLELYTPYKSDKRAVYYARNDKNQKIYYVTPSEQTIQEKDLQWQGYYDNNRRFGNFDVRWEFQVSYKAFKIIDLNFYSDLRYVNGLKLTKGKYGSVSQNFEDGAERVQWKGTWGIGIGYAF